MTIAISLLTALIGAVLYLLAGSGKAAELGRIAFFVGLLALIAGLARSGLVLR